MLHLIGEVEILTLFATNCMVHQEPARLQGPVDSTLNHLESSVQVFCFPMLRV